MIPVLGIPVINRPDLLAKCIASIDHPVGRLVIIDNSPNSEMGEIADANLPLSVEDLFVTEPPANLGFAASVNLVIKTHPGWWAFANADVEFAPGDLGRIAEAMQTSDPLTAGIVDWRLFGHTRAFIEKVGLWDENFHPVYCEDADMEYRAKLAGAELRWLAGVTTHVGSVCLGDERNARHNSRTHPENARYYLRKWGGGLRGGERFTTPFDRGGWVGDWTLEVSRLAAQAWD